MGLPARGVPFLLKELLGCVEFPQIWCGGTQENGGVSPAFGMFWWQPH